MDYLMPLYEAVYKIKQLNLLIHNSKDAETRATLEREKKYILNKYCEAIPIERTNNEERKSTSCEYAN